MFITRAAVADVMDADHVMTARAIGLRPLAVRRRHIVPSARLPIVTQIALNLGFVLGGAITVEALFSWPGVGLATLQAIQNKDFPMLQGLYLVTSALVIFCNLAADLLYARLDPRVRTRMSAASPRRGRGRAPHPRRARRRAGGGRAQIVRRAHAHAPRADRLRSCSRIFVLMAIFGHAASPRRTRTRPARSRRAPRRTSHRRRARTGSAPTSRGATCSPSCSTRRAISLAVGLAAALISTLLGALVGIVAGYFGGWVDRVLMAIDDWVLVIPFIPTAIVIASLLGTRADSWPLGRESVLILVIGALGWAGTSRIVRSQVLTLKRARLRAAGARARLDRPHDHGCATSCPASCRSCSRTRCSTSRSRVLAETTLSFLGLGDPHELLVGPDAQRRLRLGRHDAGQVGVLHPARASA